MCMLLSVSVCKELGDFSIAALLSSMRVSPYVCVCLFVRKPEVASLAPLLSSLRLLCPTLMLEFVEWLWLRAYLSHLFSFLSFCRSFNSRYCSNSHQEITHTLSPFQTLQAHEQRFPSRPSRQRALRQPRSAAVGYVVEVFPLFPVIFSAFHLHVAR